MNSDNYQQHAKKIGQLSINDSIALSTALTASNQTFYSEDANSSFSKTLDLSVRYVSQDEYHRLMTTNHGTNGFEQKTIYVVAPSDIIDAYNKKISNVADPTSNADAATKKYVDEKCNDIINNIDSLTIDSEETVVQDSNKPVKSKGIYSTLDSLSTNIIETINFDPIDTVENNKANPVRSTGIFSSLRTLSTTLTSELSLEIGTSLIKNSNLILRSSTIYDALDTLSTKIVDELSPTYSETVIKNGENPVISRGIYGFVESVSSDIKTEAMAGFVPSELLDNVEQDSEQGVKSKGIYQAIQNSSVGIDSELDSNSSRAVQNKVIKAEFDNINDSISYIYDNYIPRSGCVDVGPIHIAADLSVTQHGLIGNKVDFTTGGPENLAVGHSHKFFGKESLAVHDGNIVGAKGFYWKAIDTDAKKIYLTKTQPIFDRRCIDYLVGANENWYSTDARYDVPYFGPKRNSVHEQLFEAEEGIHLVLNDVKDATGSTVATGINGKIITVYNCLEKYLRCFKVTGIDATGSVITYEDVTVNGNPILSESDKHTVFRKKDYNYDDPNGRRYTDNQYVIYFPDMDQHKISCNIPEDAERPYVTSTSFGCTALGDGNSVMGYNSLASGKGNRAEGHYSVALGLENKARGNCSLCFGHKSITDENYVFAWSGNGQYTVSRGNNRTGTFNINPKNGISGVYVGNSNFIECVVNAIKGMSPDQRAEVNSYLGSTDMSQSFIGKLDSLSNALCSEIRSLSSDLSVDVTALSANLCVDIGTLNTSYSAFRNTTNNSINTINTRHNSLSANLSNQLQDLSDNISADEIVISNYLDNRITTLKTTTETNHKALSVNLSTDVKSLSSKLSIDVRHLSSNLSAYDKNLSDYIQLCVEVSCQNLCTDIENIKIDGGEGSSPITYFKYIGEAKLQTTYYTVDDVQIFNKLYGLLLTNPNIADNKVSFGTLINVVVDDMSEINDDFEINDYDLNNKIILNNNDYILIVDDIDNIEGIGINQIKIIKDSTSKISQITNKVNTNTANIAAQSTKITTLQTNYSSLRGDVDRLQNGQIAPEVVSELYDLVENVPFSRYYGEAVLKSSYPDTSNGLYGMLSSNYIVKSNISENKRELSCGTIFHLSADPGYGPHHSFTIVDCKGGHVELQGDDFAIIAHDTYANDSIELSSVHFIKNYDNEIDNIEEELHH